MNYVFSKVTSLSNVLRFFILLAVTALSDFRSLFHNHKHINTFFCIWQKFQSNFFLMIKYLSVSFVYFCFYIKKIRAILFEFLPSLSISHYYYFVEQIAQKKKKKCCLYKKKLMNQKRSSEFSQIIALILLPLIYHQRRRVKLSSW